MNATEAGQLLVVLATIGGREPSSAQAIGWAMALDDVPYELAEEALRAAVKEGAPGPITAQTIRRHAAPLLRRLERDVRSAKLRRYVPDDWPPSRPLPPAVVDRLRDEFDLTNDRGELGSAAPTPKELRP